MSRTLTPWMSSLVALLLLGAASPALAQVRVAVEDGSPNGTGAAVVTQLNDDTWFDFTATLVTAGDIDTVAELNNYDVVIFGGSGNNNADHTAAMWAAVRTWVDAGGGVVAAGWFNHEINTATDPGAADADYVVPTQNIASTNQFVSGAPTLDITSGPAHPVTNGLSNFAPGANFVEVNRVGAEANDTVLGTILGVPGDLAVVIKDNIGAGSGRSVYLGPLFMASSSYNPSVLRSGDADRLLEQAVEWAANSGPAPVVTGVSPDPVDWLATLTITGTDLDNASSVTIGGTAATITSNTSTQIDVTVADTTPTGSQTVAVTTPGGTDSSQTVTVNGIAPTITGASPDPVDWLATLAITGTALANATSVTIGGTAATITSNTSARIEVTVTDGTPTGSQPVVVTTAEGNDTTNVTVNGVAPTVTNVSPDPVDWLATLTITGTALATTTGVTIGGVAAAITSTTSTQVDVTVDITTPTGSQPVAITTSGGSDNSQTVTVNGIAPTVTSVSPDPVATNGTLTIDGSALLNATSVTIGGVAGTILTNTATQITVQLATSTPLGTAQVVAVTTPIGTDNTATVDVILGGAGGGGGGGGGCCAAGGEHDTSAAWLLAIMALCVAIVVRRRVA